ncbi:choice-of-anchor M domain-containing protein [Myceligenerans pegani]|uniref:Choice-of-anchor M domain-containing protein n=1 Tax=Myceligenerans pegani TaxID=2776917 RepID=A0ABR9N327_9MICO|nr:choice-of-anchor M domain-containing protein [Myceligenerans sp. TRM 65318]MBE1878059.1 choice-of-anchor M domain-containing protein [Myceligenerans sp. TRM 65318]MBE3020330.1 choice-of-anchor M domain-containing protein [Myceligenerans sp. TRM 65318]
MVRTSLPVRRAAATVLAVGLVAAGAPAVASATSASVTTSTAPAQRPPSAPAVTAAGQAPRAVLDDGNAFVNALLVEGEPVIDVGWSAEPGPATITDRYAPDDVVVSVPRPIALTTPDDAGLAPLGPPGTPLWATSQDFPALDYTGTDVVPRLNNYGLPRDQVARNGVSWEITGVRGGGLVAIGGPVPMPDLPMNRVWYAGHGLHTDVTWTPSAASISPPQAQGWLFSDLGLHCLDLRVSVTGTDGQVRTSPVVTVRVAVGNVPDPATAECGAPVDPDLPVLPPDDGGDPGDPDPDAPDPDDLTDPRNNVLLPATHSDLSLRPGDDELRLMVRESHGNTLTWYDPATLVVHVPDTARVTVPEPTASADSTFLAPAGSVIHRLPKVPKAGLPWLGVSSETFRAQDYDRLPMMRLESVTGADGGPPPGEFFLGADEDHVRSGAAPWFSTRQGLPQAHPALAPSLAHKHLSWDFTAPGTYCARFTSTATTTDGAPRDDDMVLTFIVGGTGYDPTSAPTCMQREADRARSHDDTSEDAVPGEVTRVPAPEEQGRAAFAALTPRLTDGELTAGLVTGDLRGHGVRHDPADVVLTTGTTARGLHVERLREDWRDAEQEYIDGYQLGPGSGLLNAVDLDLAHLDRADWSGDLTWTLDDATGPGEFLLVDDQEAFVPGHKGALLSTVPGYEAAGTELRPGGMNLLRWVFTAAGRYCVTTTLAGTAADGTTASATTTLTIAAGVDPAQVEPCPAGGDPGPGDPDPGDPDPGDPDPGDPAGWPVTDRTVLRSGHVDLLARVAPGGLTTVVRDDAVVPAEEHDPADVAFAVPDNARVAVPDDDRYGFLGQPADPVWVLPESPTPDLVWPGWNLEVMDGAAADAVRMALLDVDGPGDFVLFDSGGDDWGAPRVLLGAGTDRLDYAQHAHGSWAFTAAGVYCLDVSQTAVDGDVPTAATDRATLLFAVGVDARRVTEEHCGLTAAQFAAGPQGPGPDDPGTGPDDPGDPDDPGPDPDGPGTGPDDPSNPDDPGNGQGPDGDRGPGPGNGDPAPAPDNPNTPATGSDGTPAAGSTPADRGPLASTGSEVGAAVLLAVSLVGVGIVLIELRRRSRARRRLANG